MKRFFTLFLLLLLTLSQGASAAFPTTFATLSGNQPLALFDAMFTVVGSMGQVQTTATGTNAYVLALNTNMPTQAAYANYQLYGFVAPATSTSTVTIQVGSLAALPLYKSDGATQANSNDITSGVYYVIAYNSALQSGNGGFQIVGPTSSSSSGGGGGITLLNTVNASASSSVVFGSSYITSTYNKYIIQYDGVYMNSSGCDLVITESTNNGSSYIGSAYSYGGTYQTTSGGPLTASGSGSASTIDMGVSVVNSSSTSTAPDQGTITFSNPSASAVNYFIYDNVTNGNLIHGTGRNTTTTPINNIKFSFQGCTVTGNFHLYGLSGN